MMVHTSTDWCFLPERAGRKWCCWKSNHAVSAAAVSAALSLQSHEAVMDQTWDPQPLSAPECYAAQFFLETSISDKKLVSVLKKHEGLGEDLAQLIDAMGKQNYAREEKLDFLLCHFCYWFRFPTHFSKQQSFITKHFGSILPLYGNNCFLFSRCRDTRTELTEAPNYLHIKNTTLDIFFSQKLSHGAAPGTTPT